MRLPVVPPQKPFSIISIRGKWSKWVTIPKNFAGCSLLKMMFEDWDDIVPGRTITEEQARRMLQFGDAAIREGKDLLIHCEAGESRSVAVGIALALRTETEICFHEYGDLLL